MSIHRHVCLITLAVASAVTLSLNAQTPGMGQSVETTIKLGPAVFWIERTAPIAPSTVPAGAKLTLTFSDALISNAVSATWYRGSQILPETSPVLTLPSVRANDSGFYHADFVDAAGRRASSDWVAVAVTGHLECELVNISSRHDLTAGGTPAIVGFVIRPSTDPSAQQPMLLIRGIGPTLGKLGVDKPLPDPVVRLFDSSGREIQMQKGFAAVIYPDGSTPESRYRDNLRGVAQGVGAFPVPVDGTEFVETMELPPGAYTLHGASRSGKAGTLLLEVYQVPTLLQQVFY